MGGSSLRRVDQCKPPVPRRYRLFRLGVLYRLLTPKYTSTLQIYQAVWVSVDILCGPSSPLGCPTPTRVQNTIGAIYGLPSSTAKQALRA